MADLHRVEPVGEKCVIGEARQLGRLLHLHAMDGPASSAPDQEGCKACCDRRKRAEAAAGETIEIKTRRRCFVLQMSIPLAKQFRLLAPRSDPRGIIGMC